MSDSFVRVTGLLALGICCCCVAPPFIRADEIIEGSFDASTPLNGGRHYHFHPVTLKAGVNYHIELVSPDFSPLTALWSDNNTSVAMGSPKADDLNRAQMTYAPERAAQFSILATSAKPGSQGRYKLTVREATPPEPAPAPVLKPVAVELSAEERQAFDLINTERVKKGLAPFVLQSQLQQAAEEHAVNMHRTGLFEHDIEGKGVNDRVTALGYYEQERGPADKPGAGSGENISMAATPRELFDGWLNSPIHKANMLSEFPEAGLALVTRDGQNRWVLVIGKPYPPDR